MARRAIENGADPDIENHEGTTPLIAAGGGGGAEMVKFLLAAGADRERRNRFGISAPSAAKNHGRSTVVALLQEARPAAGAQQEGARQVATGRAQAEPVTATPKPPTGRALAPARPVGQVAAAATFDGHWEGSISCPGESTPSTDISIVVRAGRFSFSGESVHLSGEIDDDGDVSARARFATSDVTFYGKAAGKFIEAWNTHGIACSLRLARAFSPEQRRANRFVAAAAAGDMKRLNDEIRGGMDVNTANHLGKTALVVAAENGHRDVVNFLLTMGADVNRSDKGGSTALFMAASYGYRKIVELLVKSGADPMLQNNVNNTPISVTRMRGYSRILALLEKAGSTDAPRQDTGRQAAEDGRRLAEAERKTEEAKRLAAAERKRHAEDAKRLAAAERKRQAEDAKRLAAAERKRQAEDAKRLAAAERKRQAEDAKRLAAAERKRHAEDAKRLAAAERKRQAEDAKRLAAAERKRQAEDAKRLAAAERKRQAEDAKRLAAAERKRQAEDAKRLAAAKRKRQAEEDARRQAETERQRKTQEARRLAAEARQEELALWNDVRGSREAADFRRYLDAFPSGDFAALAAARIEQAEALAAQQAELALWSRIKGSRKVEDFEAYVRAYPDGLFADFAKTRIQTLEASAAQRAEAELWDTVKDSRKAADLERYLAGYPNGRYAAAAKTRLERLSRRAEIEGIEFGRYHALVMGSNRYTYLPALRTAETDARAVARTLEDRYGFDVTLLINGTREAMIGALDGYRRRLTDRDNLLVYYAGHGYFDEEAQRGYWLPVNARPDSTAQWVSNATITDQLKTIRAKHIMVVADSCYSGALTRGIKIGIRTQSYFATMARKRARTVLTSGGLEPVADGGGGKHSVFAKAFLAALQGNTEVMDGTQLFQKLRRPVMVNAPQTPQYSDIRFAGHDGGDFLFVSRP